MGTTTGTTMATTGSMKLHAPACERNRAPILEVLRPRLASYGRPAVVLEIACGTGQHCGFLARHLEPHVSKWIPTDLDMDERKAASVAAWADGEGSSSVVDLPARELDTRTPNWAGAFESVTHVYIANMTHISPWASTVGLMEGAGSAIARGGSLFVYGPFFGTESGKAPSNLQFDQSLRARDAEWGIREIARVEAEANKHGLALEETVEMPANNLILVFKK